MQSSHRNFGPPRLPFPSTVLWQFLISHSFHMSSQCQPTAHQFLLNTFLLTPTSTLCSSILLLSTLLAPMILLTRLFSQTWTFSCCSSGSAIVTSAFMYAGVTHELSTFSLDLGDMRLSPITPSTFLQATVSAVTLIITKAN